MTTEELRVIITLKTEQFKQKLKEVKKQTEDLATTTTKTSNSMSLGFKNIAKGAGVAAMVAATVKISKKAIEMASALEEVQNVVEVSFGSMGAEIERFAQNAIEQFGMSELSAKQLSSTFMAMGNGMRITGENGKNMALNLTALTADMASFYDVSQDVASTALKSIYTGETESLKKFGIVMTEVNLQEFARQQGIRKSISEMGQAEKTLLRYNYVMQSTAYAQGDFARTSGSWANQTRILKQQWESFLGIAGKQLITLLTPALRLVNKLLGGLISIANVVSKIFGGSEITKASTAFDDVGGGVENLNSNLQDSTSNAKKLKRQLMGFDELNVVQPQNSGSKSNDNSSLGGGIADGAVKLNFDTAESQADSLKSKIEEVADSIENFLTPSVRAFQKAFNLDKVKKSFNDLKNTVKDAFDEFKSNIDVEKWKYTLERLFKSVGNFMGKTASGVFSMFKNIVDESSDELSKPLQDFVNNELPNLTDKITDLIDKISPKIEPGLKKAGTVIGKSIGFIGGRFYDFAGKVVDKLSFWIEMLGEVIDFISTVFNRDWDEAWAKIKDVFKLYIDEAEKNVKESLDKLKSIGSFLKEKVLQPIKDFFDDLKAKVKKAWDDIWENIKNTFKRKIDEIKNNIKENLDKFKSVGGFIKERVVQPIKNHFNDLQESLKKIWGNIWQNIKKTINSIIGGINGMIRGIVKGVNTVVKAFNTIHFDIPEWVPSFGGKSFGFNIKEVSTPQIPYLAKGGILTKPTLNIAGEAGAEGVFPLTGVNADNWMDNLARKIFQAFAKTGDSTITLQVDGQTLGKVTIDNINNITRQQNKLPLVIV